MCGASCNFQRETGLAKTVTWPFSLPPTKKTYKGAGPYEGVPESFPSLAATLALCLSALEALTARLEGEPKGKLLGGALGILLIS